jgi:hypothetical protein
MVAVFVRFENRLATIPAGHQMVNRAGILVTQCSWDGASKGGSGSNIRRVLSRSRHDKVHKPSKEFSAKARIPSMAAYKKLYKQSIDKPEKFWAGEAKELTWRKKWKGARMEGALRQMVRGRQTQRL